MLLKLFQKWQRKKQSQDNSTRPSSPWYPKPGNDITHKKGKLYSYVTNETESVVNQSCPTLSEPMNRPLCQRNSLGRILE